MSVRFPFLKSALDDGGAQGQGRGGGGVGRTVQIIPGEIRVGDEIFYIMRREDSNN